MKRKQWILLLICLLLLSGYCRFFVKTWSNNTVGANADCVVALDIKRITNTIIWNYITTPSQWKNISLFSSKKEISLDDIIEVPDFVFIFHNAGEPLNVWYTLFKIRNAEAFEKGLKQFHFEQQGGNEYVNIDAGISLLRNGNQLLVGNVVPCNQQLRQTADAILSGKYIDKIKLQQLVKENSHAAMKVFDTSFITILSGCRLNFDKESLRVDADISLPEKLLMPARQFKFCDTSMCVMGFVQPQQDMQQLLDSNVRTAFSKAVNFNIDSLLVSNNYFYQLDIEGLHDRIDSAISFSYDDNFNPVEKKVVNSVEEPSFIFSIAGKSSQKLYQHWYNTGKLEPTPEGDLFTPVPFVKSYCRMQPPDTLLITSNNYKGTVNNQSVKAMAFLHVVFSKIPSSIMKFVPASLIKSLANIETLNAVLIKKDDRHVIEISCDKKKNELPLFSLF